MKKIFSMVITIVLTLTTVCIPIPVSAETYGDFEYSINENDVSVTITAYTGSDSDVVIPESIDGYAVTSICDYAFFEYINLTSVTIPDSVTTMGGFAFAGCPNLKTAGPIGGGYDYEFGWSEAIPDGAFSGCEYLTSITIPDSVTSIGAGAFSYCTSLMNITIPDGITSINSSTFYTCSSLTDITIPDSVTSIGDSAFMYCSDLTNVTIPDSVTSIGDFTFAVCTNLTDVTIPDEITSIGVQTFFYCSSLTSITIPASVTSIDEYSSFDSCPNLNTVYIDSHAILSELLNGSPCGCLVSNANTILVNDTIDQGTEELNSKAYRENITWDGKEYRLYSDHEQKWMLSETESESVEQDGKTIYKCTDCSAKKEVASLLLGDTDSSGTVNVLDAITIVKYISGWFDGEENPPINLTVADVNSDGTVNVLDAIYIVKHVAGYEDSPL